MQILAIACQLPNPDYFLLFHAHLDERKVAWTPEDTQRYEELCQLVERLYARRTLPSELKPLQREALTPPGVSRDTALQRLVPYRIEANRRSRGARYLQVHRDSVVTLATAGTDVAHGLAFTVIVKGRSRLVPTPRLLAGCRPASRALQVRHKDGSLQPLETYRPGLGVVEADGTEVDLDSLAFRSDPRLVAMVRQPPAEPLVSDGTLKVVAYPRSLTVRLTGDRSGELIEQEPRRWT